MVADGSLHQCANLCVSHMWVSVCAQVVGVFGMNLNSHIMEKSGPFTQVVVYTCAGLLALALMFYALLQRYLRT
jgi:hypothetical protein